MRYGKSPLWEESLRCCHAPSLRTLMTQLVPATITKSLRCGLLKVLVLTALVVFSVYVFDRRSTFSLFKHYQLLPKELYKLISPVSYTFLLNQPDLCQNRKPFLLLLIPVRPQDSESRTAVRETWGQENLVQHVDIARVFFVGELKERDSKLEEDLNKESVEHRDIVQMDFLDTYNNLTIKTMMIMNWVTKYCQNAEYAMKIDADIFLNVPYLVDYLQNKARHDYITGSVITDGQPRRDPNSKWYLSEEQYSETWFPPYLSGAGYVFSVDLAKRILMASKFVRPIPMEDVYVGLCLHFLDVQPRFACTLLPFRNLFEVQRMDYDRCTFARRILVSGFSSTKLMSIWVDFQKSASSCS